MQNREPPAYQEYPAAMLAKREYRLMTATERGLLYSMRMECWVNKSLPAEPGALAIILGLDAGEVAAALPAVMPFFTYVGEEIVCPELDRYREHLETRKLLQSEGGRHGAAITNSAKKKPRRRKAGVDQGIPGDAATPSATPTSNPTATPAASGRVLSTAKSSKAKSNPPSGKGLPPVDPWIADYDAATVKCSADEYAGRRG